MRHTPHPASPFQHAWAKAPYSDDSIEGDLEGPQWLPLHVHLTDTAEIAGRLCREWLGPGPLDVIAQDVGGPTEAGEIVRLAAAVHDLGKLTPAFAAQVDDLRNHMHANGFPFNGITAAHSRELPHSLAGHVLIHRFLVEAGANDEIATAFAVIIGGHHGVPPTSAQLLQAHHRPDLFGPKEWADARHQLLDYLLTTANLRDALRVATTKKLSDAAQVLITGLVIMADWIASSADHFPLAPRFNPVKTSPHERAEAAWQKLALPRRWQPAPVENLDATELLRSRFTGLQHVTANPVQELAVEAARNMPEPGLLIVEAVMGVGKTEASLLAAEILAAKFGMSGIFYGLPTRATADAMFVRITRWLEQVPDRSGSSVKSLVLRHGTAALNPDLETIPRQWADHPPTFDDAQFSGVGIDENVDDLSSRAIQAVVHSWTSAHKRASLADFTIATVDHQLMAALAARHFVLRQLGLSRQVVVLDEVHAADTWMRTFLLRALEWLARLRVPVIALSATLAPELRRELVQAYERGRRAGLPPPAVPKVQPRPAGRLKHSKPPIHQVDDTPLPEPLVTDDYPLLTTLAAGQSGHRSATISTSTVEVRVDWLLDPVEHLLNLLKNELADGGCALVVCNTVKRAVERYQALTGTSGWTVTLAHSRFIAADRMRNDAELRADFGPPDADGPAPNPARDRRVVVATQVAEQSLDVDFDLLITDLAPIDLILQRMGRLHRHPRGDTRPTRLRTPRCLITGFDPAAGPIVDPGGKHVYGEHPLLRAACLLTEHVGGKAIRLPGDVPTLVRRAYADEPLGPDEWQQTMDDAAVRDNEARLKVSRNAASGTIQSPGATRSLLSWLPTPGAKTEIDAARQVRQDDGGFEVLLLEQAEDGLRLPHHLETGAPMRIPTDCRPDRVAAKEIARCAVRVPGWVSERHLTEVIAALNENYYPAWQKEPLLAGQWILLLGPDGTAQLGSLRFSYSPTTGLEVSDGRITER